MVVFCYSIQQMTATPQGIAREPSRLKPEITKSDIDAEMNQCPKADRAFMAAEDGVEIRYAKNALVETPVTLTTYLISVALSWRTPPMGLDRHGLWLSRLCFARLTWFCSPGHSPFATDRVSLSLRRYLLPSPFIKGADASEHDKKKTGISTNAFSSLNAKQRVCSLLILLHITLSSNGMRT